MSNVPKLAETVNGVHAAVVDAASRLEEMRIDAETQRQEAVAAVNAAFDQFNAAMERHLHLLRGMLGE